MTKQELKKLRRMDLLELLIQQCEENEKLKQQLADIRKELESRRIDLEEAGSIAEAALRINSVFEAAQNAANQYLENVQAAYDSQQETCMQMKEENERLCSQKMEETEQFCRQLEQETKERCSRMVRAARKKSQAYYDEARNQVNSLLDNYSGLRDVLETSFGKDEKK